MTHSADKNHAADMASAVAAAGATPTGQTTGIHTPDHYRDLRSALEQVGRQPLTQPTETQSLPTVGFVSHGDLPARLSQVGARAMQNPSRPPSNLGD